LTTRKRQVSASHETTNLSRKALEPKEQQLVPRPARGVGQVLFFGTPWSGSWEQPWFDAPFSLRVLGRGMLWATSGTQLPGLNKMNHMNVESSPYSFPMCSLMICAVVLTALSACSGCGNENRSTQERVQWNGEDSGYQGTTEVGSDGKVKNMPQN
jgi:hypothetical protein